MADNSKVQTSAHKTQISETQSPHPQNFEVTFELAFGREMSEDERRYFGLQNVAA